MCLHRRAPRPSCGQFSRSALSDARLTRAQKAHAFALADSQRVCAGHREQDAFVASVAREGHRGVCGAYQERHDAAAARLAVLRSLRADTAGEVLTKYNSQRKPVKKRFAVSEDGTEITWGPPNAKKLSK